MEPGDPALWPAARVLGALADSGPVSSLQVLGLLVWALIADTPYHLYPAYGWVMFVAVFLWLVTIVFFVLYLFQLHMKLYRVPWPLVVSLGGCAGMAPGLSPLLRGWLCLCHPPEMRSGWVSRFSEHPEHGPERTRA